MPPFNITVRIQIIATPTPRTEPIVTYPKSQYSKVKVGKEFVEFDLGR